MNTANREAYDIRLALAVSAATKAIEAMKDAQARGHGNDTSLMDAVPYLQAALELVK
jgi:hypothetical protein